jgi:hypothetical protein
MDDNDFKLEAYLREFELRRPRPLQPADVAWHARHRLAAAAALIVALCAISVWLARHRESKRGNTQSAALSVATPLTPGHAPSTIELTRAALDDGREFDHEMDSLAQRSLPGFERKDSTLRVLAKD